MNDFNCVVFFRDVKNRISAELNAMTPHERSLYFERSHQEALQIKIERERSRIRNDK